MWWTALLVIGASILISAAIIASSVQYAIREILQALERHTASIQVSIAQSVRPPVRDSAEQDLAELLARGDREALQRLKQQQSAMNRSNEQLTKAATPNP
jgi:hypothetical protein